jgi:DNA invertase Pin-like site-specific DNA recombinase
VATGRFIAYYRVSTARQGKSGLGLDAQRTAVRQYLNGGQWKLVEEETEVESGKRSDRPALARALAACRLHNATLVIASHRCCPRWSPQWTGGHYARRVPMRSPRGAA